MGLEAAKQILHSAPLGGANDISNSQCHSHPKQDSWILQRPGEVGTISEPTLFWDPHSKVFYQGQVVEPKVTQGTTCADKEARQERQAVPSRATFSQRCLPQCYQLQSTQCCVDLPIGTVCGHSDPWWGTIKQFFGFLVSSKNHTLL